MRLSIGLVAVAATVASALQFTGPAADSTLTRGSEFEVTWDTVDTDPSPLSLYLVNFLNWPPYYAPLEYNVNTASGAQAVRIPCDIDATNGYQINAINGTNVYIIYAQSPEFSIGGAACTDPVAATSTCPPPSTVTVTVSGTRTLTAPTYSGTCPSVIGWNGGYNAAVTLTKVPRADQPLITAGPAPGQWGDWNGDSDGDVYVTKTVTRVHTAYEDCSCQH